MRFMFVHINTKLYKPRPDFDRYSYFRRLYERHPPPRDLKNKGQWPLVFFFFFFEASRAVYWCAWDICKRPGEFGFRTFAHFSIFPGNRRFFPHEKKTPESRRFYSPRDDYSSCFTTVVVERPGHVGPLCGSGPYNKPPWGCGPAPPTLSYCCAGLNRRPSTTAFCWRFDKALLER